MFDEAGNELSSNDDGIAPGEEFSLDSFLTFTIGSTGNYYVGVSELSNSSYDPLNESDTENSTEQNGEYQLEISLADEEVNVDPDDTISEAIATELDEPGETVTISNTIDNPADVDVYQFQLEAGEAIVVNRSLDSTNIVYRVFDESGNFAAGELITTNALSDKIPNANRFQGNSALSFIPETSGNYYLGVSVFDNEAYNPIDGSGAQDGFFQGSNYELEFELLAVTTDKDPDNTIPEAIATPLENGTAVIDNSIDSGDDVDLYQLELNAGATLVLDIDADELDSSLDSALRLFDANGVELTSSDDNFDSPDEPLNFDSYLSFNIETSDTYYVGVSSFVNVNYDPVNGTTNIPQFNRERGGFYQLQVNVTGGEVTPRGGTEGADRLDGTDSDDALNGFAGEDRIRGFAGSDTLDGGDGNDTLLGGNGDDLLNGGNGNDALVGVAGDDTLNGGAGGDRLKGRSGNDVLDGGEDNDLLFGGGGHDILIGGHGEDILNGGGASDTFVLASGQGKDTIEDFGLGDDRLGLSNGLSFADLSFAGENINVGHETIATLSHIDTTTLTEDRFISI